MCERQTDEAAAVCTDLASPGCQTSSHMRNLVTVGQLAAGVAHEINTPIHYVADNTRFLIDAFDHFESLFRQLDEWLETASDQMSDDPCLQRLGRSMHSAETKFYRQEATLALRQTLEGAESVTNIAHALKEFSHPGSNEPEETSINNLLQSVILVSKNEWKHHARLELRVDPQLPTVLCHPHSLRQAILNLIVNAAHAIRQAQQHPQTDSSTDRRIPFPPEQYGTLSVATEATEGAVTITIGDTGTGIPEELRSKVFEPYFTTKPLGEGTGQGLAIALQAVTGDNAGKLRFTSQLGVGTEFVIELPLTPPCGATE